jgi:benzoyl-CoA reductase/2-hydroxyglutaryl-CoA dehydratase subunit BcrC/BadD/HgdB
MKIGFTTSLPVEVILAAGHTPVDLNNIFVTGNAQDYVEAAEFDGYPRNICSWIKGLYSVALQNNIDTVVGVVEGDCSNTHSLMATLQDKGVRVLPFSFPHTRDRQRLADEIARFEQLFEVDHAAVLAMKQRLDGIRRKLVTLDELTWRQHKVTGLENHLWLINASDFEGDPDAFETRLDAFLAEAQQREPIEAQFHFAYLGVPPILTDLYDVLQDAGVHVIFNEVQRQFAMPYLAEDMTEQYLRYTYPYDIFYRLADIRQELSTRNVDGVISYAQSFCHRQIDGILIKKAIDLPILTVEGDAPGKLDARTRLRIESFLDMLRY